MHRLNYLNIKKRQLVTGLHYYEDDFIGSDLRKYSFYEALHLYLKSEGYKTILFFNTSGGLASFEEEMLMRFLTTVDQEHDSNGTNAAADVVVPPVINGRLSGNALTRRINKAKKSMSEPAPSPVNVTKPHSNLYLDPSDGMWHMRGRNDRQYAVDCMAYNLRERRDLAIIVKANESEPEFQPTVAQMLIDQLHNVELQSSNKGRHAINNNRFIVLIKVDRYRHNILKMYDDTNQDPLVSVFLSRYFKNKYLCIPKDADFTTLNPDYAHMLSSPTEKDVINLVMKVRYEYPEKIHCPVDWAVLPDIANQLELQDDNTLRRLYGMFIDFDSFDYSGFRILNVKKRGDAKKDLQGLIGMDDVKSMIDDLVGWIKLKQSRGEDLAAINKHMMFYGNPGTGKTTVARLIGQIFKDLGLLKKGHCVEVTREGLVGQYIGQTAIKTRHAVEMALDGVLFVDEAYALAQGREDSNDFGQEAMATLIAMMENYRDRLVVIFAGYKEDMQNLFRLNQGLRSRINRYIDFKDYNVDELIEIFHYNIRGKYTLAPGAEQALAQAIEYILGFKSRNHNDRNYKFANARTIRNLFEDIEMNIARRSMNSDSSIILPSDFEGLTIEEMVGFRYTPAETETTPVNNN